MRALLLIVTVLAGTATVAAQSRVALPWGWYGPYNNNEWATVSQVGDPPGSWWASREGPSLGFNCFGRERSDGRLECLVLVQGKQDERTRGLPAPHSLTGELTWHIRDGSRGGGDDAQFVKVMEMRHDVVCIFDTCIRPRRDSELSSLRGLLSRQD